MRFISKKNSRLENIHIITTHIIRTALVLAIFSAFIRMNWLVIFISSITLFLTFLPVFIEKKYRICLPVEFQFLVIIFVFSSIFLGEVHQYYTKFWWWDLVLHAGSSMALGMAGFIILYAMYAGNKIRAAPVTIALFSFSFALAMGVVWEIFEFTLDGMLGTNMQRSGLVDTMWDLIVDAGGAFITSTLGYIYIKGGKTHLFERLIKRFVSKNQHIFE